MKTIGLLGGMSWESTAVYYRRLNELVAAQIGGLASAQIVLHSVNFAEVDQLQHSGRWEELAALLVKATRGLAAAGADFVVLATNTMHKVAERIEEVGLPLLHIVDATAEAIRESGFRRVGLLGTRFTMEDDFYTGRLRDEHAIETIVPESRDRHEIHRIIYEELCAGAVKEASRRALCSTITRLKVAGAEAVILGCTELPLLIRQSDVDLPLFDTTEIHVRAAVESALR